MVTEADVEEIARVEGLVAGAKLLGFGNHDNADLIAALARGASSRNTLISEPDVSELEGLGVSSFFEI